MIAYRVLLGIALLVAAAILFFFLWGLSDGSVSASNIALWLAMLAAGTAALVGAAKLRSRGHLLVASLLLLVLALPGILFGLVVIVLIIAQPTWH